MTHPICWWIRVALPADCAQNPTTFQDHRPGPRRQHLLTTAPASPAALASGRAAPHTARRAFQPATPGLRPPTATPGLRPPTAPALSALARPLPSPVQPPFPLRPHPPGPTSHAGLLDVPTRQDPACDLLSHRPRGSLPHPTSAQMPRPGRPVPTPYSFPFLLSSCHLLHTLRK